MEKKFKICNFDTWSLFNQQLWGTLYKFQLHLQNEDSVTTLLVNILFQALSIVFACNTVMYLHNYDKINTWWTDEYK